jgi:HK97 family phage prohead protease
MNLTVQRSFEPELMDVAEGRTLMLRLVPYGVPTMVRDMTPAGDWGRPYREGFDPGAMSDAIGNHITERMRMALTAGHSDDPWRDVGRATELTEDDSGAYGAFVVDESSFGDHLLAKVRTRQWRGVSVKAVVRASRKDADGIVWRTKVHPIHAAITEHPAYIDAQVLALRALSSGSATPLLDAWLDKYPLPDATST